MGYDSLGAGCIINHLHFELIFIDDLNLESLIIEKAKEEKVFSTRFLSVKEDEIPMVFLI